MIRNFVFDMGDVLLWFDPKAFADRYDLTEEEKDYLINAIYENADWTLADWGYTTAEKIAEDVCSHVPEKYHDIVMELACKWYEPILEVDGMFDVVRKIKEKGYGLYLLSNAGLNHRDYWKTVPISGLFDGVVVSAYKKLVKPQPEIYKVLLERYKLDPDECLFIDNNKLNASGAVLCGMHAVVFKGREDFLDQLSSMGIEI